MKHLTTAIDAAILKSADREFRSHLGASGVGHPCARKIWFDFHWTTAPNFPARTLRIFARGNREEPVLIDYLRQTGATVISHTPDGNQLRVSAIGGHFGGSMDGIANGLPEQAEGDWELLEFKTHNAASFRDLESNGVEKSKLEHYVQVQMYLGLSKLRGAVYIAVNKDTDALYIEAVPFDDKTFRKYLERAEAIIRSNEPPPRISVDPCWFLCKFCDHNDVCHGGAKPERNCRTCTHSTPSLEHFDGVWVCEFEEKPPYPVIPIALQRRGCQEYRVNPTI